MISKVKSSNDNDLEIISKNVISKVVSSRLFQKLFEIISKHFKKSDLKACVIEIISKTFLK